MVEYIRLQSMSENEIAERSFQYLSALMINVPAGNRNSTAPVVQSYRTRTAKAKVNQ
jgi:hypothetical protein